MNRNIVQGRVLDEAGKPVAGAYVTVQADEGQVQDIASITTSEGRFRLSLPRGGFSVFATTKTGMHGMVHLSEFNVERFSPIIHLHC
ncbi:MULTISPECIES: carboxypeptidase-like regulatory domain-containing protein [Burkholderia cepacia complex]|uniref:carboxypeptidase-like regulatory domain-containing protein n=1 Tax=Burkholderia cepacia complex TaxID=87882 RepID=UPI0009BD644B